jgi:hypothetical protein
MASLPREPLSRAIIKKIKKRFSLPPLNEKAEKRRRSKEIKLCDRRLLYCRIMVSESEREERYN